MINKNINNTVLITGGSGYIGSCLAAYLSKMYKVICVDKRSKNSFLGKEIIHYKININNEKRIKNLVKKIKPSTIIHLAGQSTIDAVDKRKNKYFEDNLEATKRLVKIIKYFKIPNFIFSSTAAVYNKFNNKFTESSKIKSNNSYGKSKIDCENEIIKRLKNDNIKYCILRFFNVSGSFKNYKIGEFHNPETHLIPIIINSLYENKKIKIYGNNYKTKDGTCLRDYIHIKDIIKAIAKSIMYINLKKNRSDIFNLGSEKCFSVLEIIEYCSKLAKRKPKILFVKKRKYDVSFLLCDINKAKNKLNWKPKYSNLKSIISDEIWWHKYLKKKNYKRKFIY